MTKCIEIVFCWIPSHSSIIGNKWADRAARQGTNHSTNSTHIHIPLSINEIYSQLFSASQGIFDKCYQEKVLPDLHPPDTSHNCCKMGKSFNFTRSKGSTMIRILLS